jgi:hypothetical protein
MFVSLMQELSYYTRPGSNPVNHGRANASHPTVFGPAEERVGVGTCNRPKICQVGCLSFLEWGETESTLVRRPLFDLLYQPRMIDDDECGAVGGMRIGRGNRSTR